MIYFDNGATTYPKPLSVNKKAFEALNKFSFNSGRGGYYQSISTAEKIYNVREKIAELVNASSENIIFTKNCTEALNMAIKGSVKKGSHIIISSLEHNAVSRPVDTLSMRGIIDYDIAPYSFDDEETVENFKRLIKPNTTAVVCMHSSNVFGVTFPIRQIGKLCREKGIRFIVDGAQSLGVTKIDMKRDNINILCAPGHKCLYGPMGTGFMAIGENVALNTIIEGGTGSGALSLAMPDFTPDRFEAGTLNNPGIIALGEGIDYINKIGMEKIYSHEMRCAGTIYSLLSKNDDVKLYTPAPAINKSMPIVSFNYKDFSSEKVAAYLGDNNVCVRAGYHCSPLAHKHFNTTETGTVRISLGLFNNEKECYRFVNILKNL